MPTDAYVADRCSEIEENLRYAAEKSSADAELGAYLAAYISVLISGVVEDCIEYLVVQRARMARDPHLHDFVRSAIAQQFRESAVERYCECPREIQRELQGNLPGISTYSFPGGSGECS